MSPFLRFVAVVLVVLPFAGCDGTPGARDPFGAPPTITAFRFTPETFASTGSEPVVSVPLAVTVDVAGGEGEVTVRILVRENDGGDVLLEDEAVMETAQEFTYETRLEIPRGAVGDYALTVTTEDATGRPGDRASGVLAFSSASLGPPEITATASDPATLSRPTGSGSTTVTLTATVSDPDGVENLARVEIQDLNGATLFRLLDDGQGGDATAGDGRYTVRLAIRGTTPTGTFAFPVVAVDRSGRRSAPAEVTFTVQ